MNAGVPESSAHSGPRRDAERDVLRALCSSKSTAEEMAMATRRLAEYAWQDGDHRVVYEAIARCRASDGAQMRKDLPAIATRMGFPDIEWEQYFAASVGEEESAAELNEAVEKLLKYRESSGA